MELVKKNIVSIICGVVALAAICFHVFYTSKAFGTLQAEAEERAKRQDDISGLLKKDRKIPAVTAAPPAPLPQFPNNVIIADAKKVVEGLHSQADALVNQAVALNKQSYVPLVPDALPKPKSNAKYDFRTQYEQVMKPGGKPVSYDPNKPPPPNLIDGILNGTSPASPQDIVAAQKKLYDDVYSKQLITQNSVVVNQNDVVARFNRDTANFAKDYREKQAREFKVYIDPAVLAPLESLKPTNPQLPPPEDMFYGQMRYWIQKDVCEAIQYMNRQAQGGIATSPVKHVLAIDIPLGFSMYRTGGAAGAAPAAPAGGGCDGGAAAPAAAAGPGISFDVSPTGRVCNPLFDVVHYDVSVIIDAQYVRPFLRALQYLKFITVLRADLQTIDLAQASLQGYAYGDRPIVQLNVRCESLFLRKWTVENNGPMPPIVQASLGIIAPVGAPGAAPAAKAPAGCSCTCN